MPTAPMADEIFVDDGAAETSSSESGESDWQENEERERVEGGEVEEGVGGGVEEGGGEVEVEVEETGMHQI